MLAQSPLYSLMNYATETVFLFNSLPLCLYIQFYICLCMWQEERVCTVMNVCACRMCVLELVWQEEEVCKLDCE